jgi:hypothetical protein
MIATTILNRSPRRKQRRSLTRPCSALAGSRRAAHALLLSPGANLTKVFAQ